MKLFLLGVVMKYIKIFIITAIVSITILSILYLSRIAKDIQRYTFSAVQSNYIVIYSSSYGKLINGDVEDLMDYIKNSFEAIGIKVKKLGVIDDKKNIHKALERESQLNGRVVVIDISLNDKIINKDTILIRIEKNENYNNNIDFAYSIKNILNKDRVNVLGESKCYNQEFGDRAIKVEISNKLYLDEAKKLMDKLIFGIYSNIQ